MTSQFHVIAGLPRSGSTLLCNLLNQNPGFSASSTSALAGTLAAVANHWTVAPEVKSDLADSRVETESRMEEVMKGVVDRWYEGGWYDAHDRERVLFDKGRMWVGMTDRLHQLYPDARVFVTVRDPRDVLASVWRRHLVNPILDEHMGTTLQARADAMFSPDGIIGGPLTHLEDLIRRKSEVVVPVVFEDLARDPERVLRLIYAEIGQDYWVGHQFEDIESTATDLDALYLNKFPHDGSGKVEPPSGHWSDVIPEPLAAQVVARYPVYCVFFGYG